MLDSKWAQGARNEAVQLLFSIWTEVLGDVAKVFGKDLELVMCCQGEKVLEDFVPFAPKAIRQAESFRRHTTAKPIPISPIPKVSNPPPVLRATTMSMRNGKTALPTARRKFPIQPSTEELNSSKPLSLHVYFGYKQRWAHHLLGIVLSIFASHRLQSLSYISDPNNLYLTGDSRRIATGTELHTLNHQFSMGNIWRHLLPQYSPACSTLKTIHLSCPIFWSEIAYVIPWLYSLERLDCETMIMWTEPVYPMQIETVAEAGRRVLATCFNSEVNLKKERRMKKNSERKWIDIKKEGIFCPVMEAETRVMAVGMAQSRFATVDMKVCLQWHEAVIEKSRRE